MQDLLDRAFLLFFRTSVDEVIARREEIVSNSALAIEPALIDALELLYDRKYEESLAVLESMQTGADGSTDRSFVYRVIVMSRIHGRRGRVERALELLNSLSRQSACVDALAESILTWRTADCLRMQRKFNEAMVLLQKAFEVAEVSSVPIMTSVIKGDIASVYLSLGDMARAIVLYEQVMSEIAEEADLVDTVIRTRSNLASAFGSSNRNAEALREYDQLLQISEVVNEWQINVAVKLNKAIALKALMRMEESRAEYKEVRELSIENEDHFFEIKALIGLSGLCLKMEEIAEARVYAQEAHQLATERDVKSVIVETYTTLADVDRAEGLGDQAISRQREAFARLQSSGDHRKAIAVAVDLVGWLKEEQRYQDALEVQEAIATVQQSINERDLERSLEISTVRERLADERTAVRVRDEERNKVLHAVLPAHIANRLTSGEPQIVDTLPAVTILFADVVGFTELVSSMTGEALLDLLSKLFTGMDIAASRFGCERIKTIGDSYMAICGASEAVDDHIERIVRMALCVVNGEVPLPIDPSQLRIGINTGPVIAGVMDGQRIAYDVWGDTVNVAARMEEHSRPGSVSCTEAVAQGVRQIPEFNLIKREPLNIHGKGLMTTYWLEKAT
ncbi:MAG: hypothetical protein IPF79_01985 [Ignavibacteria bacterium]|nr:hypothetical protein [Ignavibacteria bacterium]